MDTAQWYVDTCLKTSSPGYFLVETLPLCEQPPGPQLEASFIQGQTVMSKVGKNLGNCPQNSRPLSALSFLNACILVII